MTTIATSIIAMIMALFIIFIRMKASRKPVTAKKIILPPIFMSTGAIMFIHPLFRVTPLEIAEAITVGAIFSIFLIKTSTFEVKDREIFLKRSKAFVFILLGLLVVRIILKTILSTKLDIGELSGMFWLLAFGMIVPWRVAMYVRYRKLISDLKG